MEQIAVVTVVTAIKGSHVTKRRGRVYMGVDLDMMGWTATKHAHLRTMGLTANGRAAAIVLTKHVIQ